MKIDDDWRYHHFRKPPHLHVSSKIRVSAASQPLISCVDSNFWKTKFKLSQRNASSFLNLLKNPCIYVVTFLISGWKHHGQIPFLLLWHTHIYIYIAKNYTTWRIPHDLQWNHQIFKFLNMWKTTSLMVENHISWWKKNNFPRFSPVFPWFSAWWYPPPPPFQWGPALPSVAPSKRQQKRMRMSTRWCPIVS